MERRPVSNYFQMVESVTTSELLVITFNYSKSVLSCLPLFVLFLFQKSVVDAINAYPGLSDFAKVLKVREESCTVHICVP